MLLRGRHYSTGEPIDVRCDYGRIVSIGPFGTSTADHEAGWIAPALFDLQINGCLGISFNSLELTVPAVRKVVDVCRTHGIGGLLPTVVTSSREAIRHGFSTLRQAVEQDKVVAAAVPGYHLEGPYISAQDGPRGAHPKPHVRPPDWQEFSIWQDAAGGLIRLVTLAPEYDDAIDFIRRLTESGVIAAIGHTAASGPRIREAIAAGARLSTHLGNGSHAMLDRHDNYIWEQLAADELSASLIPDGRHLPPAVIKCIVRGKTPARSIITCDASSLAGLPPGRYAMWDDEVEVLPGGHVVVPGTPFLAGSGVFTDSCIAHIVSTAGVSLSDAIDMASARPRELLGLPVQRVQVGDPARLMLFDWNGGSLDVRYVS